MQMQADGVSRRDAMGLAGAAIVAVPALANADVEYANVPFLGGSDQVTRTQCGRRMQFLTPRIIHHSNEQRQNFSLT